MTEAGVTVYRCVQHALRHRLGEVFPLAAAAESGTGNGGIAMSWTAHGLLRLPWDRYGIFTGAQQAVNVAAGGGPRALGYPVTLFGSGAWLACGRRGTEPGR